MLRNLFTHLLFLFEKVADEVARVAGFKVSDAADHGLKASLCLGLGFCELLLLRFLLLDALVHLAKFVLGRLQFSPHLPHVAL